MVILPSFVSQKQQRELVRWALADHAKYPNDTNLDIHYAVPTEGVWNAHLRSLSSSPEATQPILPKVAQDSSTAEELPKGPRQLINNTPASVDTISVINATPKLPPPPSSTVQPTPPSVLLYKLRWANIGWFYHWGTKQYDFAKGKGHIDPSLREICKSAVAAVDWHKVFADTTTTPEWPSGRPEWKD